MAVEDKFTDSLVAAGKDGNPAKVSGGKCLCVTFNFEVAAADDNLSKYRLARLPANAIPIRAEIYADSSLGTSEFDLGLYVPGVGGAEVDKDLFLADKDLTAGVAITAGANNGLASLAGDAPASIGKKLWELLGLSVPGRQDYDLVLTGTVTGAAAGTISGFFWYILG